MSETSFLKDEVGQVLAKALAAVALARPVDPFDYLALWLRHHLQSKERKQRTIERAKLIDAEREEWAKGRAVREKYAASVIQMEWKAFMHSVRDSQQQEALLRQQFAKIEETADDKFSMDDISVEQGDKSEKERTSEIQRLRAQAQFERARLFVAELDKSYIADLKRIPAGNKSATIVLRCVLYLQGLRPKAVDSWDKIRALIKPFALLQWMNRYNPCTTPLEKIRGITRVRRLIQNVSEDAVKSEGMTLFAVYQWLSTAVAYRSARDDHLRAKRAAGRDADEELEDEDEPEDEEKDPDEEVVKAAELEAKRREEAEAAAAGGDEQHAEAEM